MKTFNIYFKNSRGKETLIDRVQDIGGTDTGAFSNSFKAIIKIFIFVYVEIIHVVNCVFIMLRDWNSVIAIFDYHFICG